jgi:hypothetical protein
MIKGKEEQKRGSLSNNAKAWRGLQDAINFSIANNEEARERQTPHFQARKEAMLLQTIAAYKKRGSKKI